MTYGKEHERRVQAALEEFYTALDEIAGDDAVSTDWLPFVENQVGEIDGYREWVNEGWEPLYDSEAVR